jgi:alkylated DNA repair dioxygenase AlkB
MPLLPLPLEDAELGFDPHWLDGAAATALHADLRDTIAWEVHRIRLFGREHPAPRLSCWIGDADASYRYSGTRFMPQPWPRALLPIRERLSEELGVDFNSVLANRYRNGRDAMGWHADAERELGPAPVIASLSLGATRRFVLKHRQRPELKLALALPPGSLLVMAGTTQEHYRHALPRTARPVGDRINLTFRRIIAGLR